MRVPSAEIERVAGKNDIRYYLNYIHFDRDKRNLVATNGHALACITLAEDEVLPEDTSGAITEEALKAAVKAAKCSRGRAPAEMLKVNGALEIPDGPTFPRPTEEQAGKFPDYERVIPNMDQLPGKTLTFNIDLLANLAKAICDKPKSTGTQIITLHLPWHSNQPIVVTPEFGEIDGRIGVLMPARGARHGDCELFERPKPAPVPTQAEIDATARKHWKAAWRRARAWMKHGTAKPRNRTEDLACACRMSRNRDGYIAASVYGVWAAQRIAG
jgi:hypothetical protein